MQAVCKGDRVFGVEMQFFLKDMAPWGHHLDVDNLCEPVFSVLVNRLQWFEGRRRNIRWWYASKKLSSESGLKLTLSAEPVWEQNLGLTPFFDHLYTGPLPMSGTDPELARWAASLYNDKPVLRCRNLAVFLRFADEKINLGNIAAGSVKFLIDCLYPILGGAPGRPEDWRNRTMAVEKCSKGLSTGCVRVTIWETDEKDV
jgi:hypothetical protein